MEQDVVKTRKTAQLTGKGPRTLFQSDAAKDRVLTVVEEKDEVLSAVIDVHAETQDDSGIDYNENITVTARKTISRTRIGNVWYNFISGKKYSVPLYVANLLEEKGVV